MPLLCPYLSGRSAFQDKLLDRTAELLYQLALGKNQALVEGADGNSVGVALTLGGDGKVLPNIHLRQYEVYYLPGDMLPSMSGIHRQKVQHDVFL